MGLLNISRLLTDDSVSSDIKKIILDYKHLVKELRVELDGQVDICNRLLDTAMDQERRERQMKSLLFYNRETGMPNHFVMDRDLDSLLKEANESAKEEKFAIFFISLDDTYNMIKKTLQPTLSEWVLYQTALRIKAEISSDCLTYQSRDDEFLVISRSVKRKEDCKRFAKRLLEKIRKSHIFSGYNISIGCSIGVSLYPDDGTTRGRLLRNADTALSESKKSIENYRVYTRKMTEEAVQRVELQNSILKALEVQTKTRGDAQFELYYQPLVYVDDVSNGRCNSHIIGSETLIRWNHPGKGFLLPDRFIPIAEETGLIIPVGHWILYEAMEQLRIWNEQEEYKNLSVSLNLSPRQFKHEDFFGSIDRVITKSRINPRNLKLEITESSVMDNLEDAVKKMEILRDRGIKILLDDFGTGYSSLTYLKRLPIDILKIDKTFVRNIVTQLGDRGIVKAIVSMAKELDIGIIVEGVETFEQLKILFEEGINVMQGFYFSKPLCSTDFNKHIGCC